MSLDFFEEYLQGIDRGRKILYLSVIVIFTVLFFYFFLIEPKIEELKSRELSYESLSKKVVEKSPKTHISTIKSLKTQIASLKNMIDKLSARELTLKTRLQELNSVLMSEKNFPQILEKMLQLSSDHSIALNQIEIEEREKKYYEKIKVKKRVKVKGSGRFLNIVKFVRGIEDSPVLMKVDRYIVETNGTRPSFELVVDYFGV